MTRFTYVYDTYCGWCYGASPVIDALIESGADVTVMHRHLFQGANAHRMGDGFGKMALQYDRRIEQLTGQEFSDAYVQNILGNPDEVLDSGLTAQAAALVHDLGAKAEIKLARTLQRARYVDGISARNSDVVRKALAEFGVELSLEDGKDQARKISAEAANLQASIGAQGVPTLLKHTSGKTTQVNISTYYELPEEIAALAA
ncbi:DsbA family protein [Tritonibacter mobilis]|nr:DsbA family protein [Tritonibacter mobilis]